MAILLGLGAALTYGAADFVGGLVSRKNSVLNVVLLSQLFGSLLLVAAVPLVADAPPGARALAWGGASGLAGGIGVLLLYRGLAVGRMSVVMPITAVEAAAVPVVYGLATGERPAATALGGVVVALIAVALVAAHRSEDSDDVQRGPRSLAVFAARHSGVAEALGAGVSFGAFFVLLDRAPVDSGIWPLVGARVASVSLVAALMLVRRGPLEVAPGTSVGIAAAGALDVTANLLYLLSTREGLLSIVAVLTSLYPASTILLARLVLHERLGRMQNVGLALAAAGVALMASG